MRIQRALNALVFAIILISTNSYIKGTKEKTKYLTMKRIKGLKTGNKTLLFINNSSYNEEKINNSDHVHSLDITNIIRSKDKTSLKIKSKTKLKSKPRKNKSSTIQRKKKRGKVFQDTREDTMHYKLIDDMMFKPLDSNNSASIFFSDESEITQDDVDQAIEGIDGSCIAIPAKRKEDIYKEFLRWAHIQEKNERRSKIEKEVIAKYINNTKQFHLFNISRQFGSVIQGVNKSTVVNGSTNLTKASKQETTHLGKQTAELKNIKQQVKSGAKSFKVESVELKYDPDFLEKLHNSVKKQKKKGRKKKLKKQKQRQTYEGNPADISADDFSAQEKFMINTQKEAMGRRYYQLFVNKTASDFWDNNTLETTKMLEFLIPLGEHLHKTLEEPPPNQGDNLIIDLQMYKAELEKFITLVKKDKAETRPDAVALLEEPYDHVCETKFSEEEIRLMFGWDDKEYKQFEQLLEEVRELWFDLQLFHHCYQFVSESAESFYSDHHNYTADELNEIIRNNTWYPPSA